MIKNSTFKSLIQKGSELIPGMKGKVVNQLKDVQPIRDQQQLEEMK
jgi:hypothetical protein